MLRRSPQDQPLSRFVQIGAVITIRLPAFATVAATTADGTITPASSPPQSPRSSSAAFLQRPPALSEQSMSAIAKFKAATATAAQIHSSQAVDYSFTEATTVCAFAGHAAALTARRAHGPRKTRLAPHLCRPSLLSAGAASP